LLKSARLSADDLRGTWLLQRAVPASKVSPDVTSPAQKRILIVDDEPAYVRILADALSAPDRRLLTASSLAGAESVLSEGDAADLVLVDLQLPDGSGIDLLRSLKAREPDVPVILITGHASMQTALSAMKLGAYDYITKPFQLDAVEPVVERALERRRLFDENRYLRDELRARFNFDRIIGRNAAIQQAYALAAKVADTNVTVLITGETGTGKEYLARAIHFQSRRANGPFVKVNCAALAETLLESELFGHEKGAFTNAMTRRAGRFEIADRGTLFLDEIGDISPAVQVRLLRVLQEREFERVGGNETIRVDVRVVAATHRDLERAVAEGDFREDLYYRLNVLPIRLPALRERPEDIPELVEHFMERIRVEQQKSIRGVSPAAMRLLQCYDWPGNIRELENTLERAFILCQGSEIQESDILLRSAPRSPAPAPPDPAPTPLRSLREVEAEHIARVLETMGGNQSRAAEILGIDRKTLRAKISAYGLGEGRP
jgi:DNA-binding NtrC family response regulator